MWIDVIRNNGLALTLNMSHITVIHWSKNECTVIGIDLDIKITDANSRERLWIATHTKESCVAGK